MQPKVTAHYSGELHVAVIKCLQQFYYDMRDGKHSDWVPDPYFDRGVGKHAPTQRDADNVILILGDEIETELARFRDYHGRRGSSTAPNWFKISTPDTRFCLAQRLYRIIDKYETEPDKDNDSYYYATSGGSVWKELVKENEFMDKEDYGE